MGDGDLAMWLFRNLEEAATEEAFNEKWTCFTNICEAAGAANVLHYMKTTWYNRRKEWSFAWKKKNFTGGMGSDSVAPTSFVTPPPPVCARC